MTDLVIERPQFTLAHHDRLVSGGEWTTPRALENQVKAIPDPVVGSSINMRKYLAFR